MTRIDRHAAVVALLCSAALAASAGCTDVDRTPATADAGEAERVAGTEVVDLVETDPVTAAEAAERVGEILTVTGHVASAAFLERSERQPTFLNLDEAYPNQALTVVIFGPDRGLFERPPKELFQGRDIAVTGEVQVYKERAEIVVKQAKAIRLLETASEIDEGVAGPAADASADSLLPPSGLSVLE